MKANVRASGRKKRRDELVSRCKGSERFVVGCARERNKRRVTVGTTSLSLFGPGRVDE